MTTQTLFVYLPIIKGTILLVGLVIIIAVMAWAAGLLDELRDIGREIDDERGGE